VSEDSEYLVVGLPEASGVKTRFKGDFDADTTYNKNEIVKYRDSLWKANRTILPQILTQPFSTFDTYINIASSADADSTSLTLLVAGLIMLPFASMVSPRALTLMLPTALVFSFLADKMLMSTTLPNAVRYFAISFSLFQKLIYRQVKIQTIYTVNTYQKQYKA
jgi:hypothetical protein